MDHAEGYAVEFKPTFWQNLWWALGFKHAYQERPEDDEAQYIVNHTTIVMDWKDRIRALVSGKLSVETVIETKEAVNLILTTQDFKVIPPFERVHRRHI